MRVSELVTSLFPNGNKKLAAYDYMHAYDSNYVLSIEDRSISAFFCVVLLFCVGRVPYVGLISFLKSPIECINCFAIPQAVMN